MRKYMLYINVNTASSSIKIIKTGHHMEGNFNALVENETDVFKFNFNYWMSYDRKKLKEYSREFLTKKINMLLIDLKTLEYLRDKI